MIFKLNDPFVQFCFLGATLNASPFEFKTFLNYLVLHTADSD